jgi:hypothetical protein
MNNEERGKIKPPNLYLYLNLIPYGSKLRQDSKTDETDYPDLNGLF